MLKRISCWMVCFLVVCLPFSSSLYAKTPVLAIPQFTVLTVEQPGNVRVESSKTVTPYGTQAYKAIEVEKLESIIKEIELPELSQAFIRHVVDTSRFTVMEQAKVDKIMGTSKAGEKDAQTLIKKGRLLGADYLVLGILTQAEAGMRDEPVAYTDRKYRVKEGILRVDMRVIEVATGKIMTAQLGQGHVIDKTMVDAVDINPDYVDHFQHDLREALATDLSAKLVDVFYPFKVVAIKDKLITANRGTDFGIAPGAVYAVKRLGKSIKDPDTGLLLGHAETVVARAKVTAVQAKLCTLEIIEGTGKVSTGDLLSPGEDQAPQ